MGEIRILLNEGTFTNLCKFGFLYYPTEMGREEIHMTKNDIKKLAKGEIIEKQMTFLYMIALQDIGSELIKEIIRRTPLYSDLYYEL